MSTIYDSIIGLMGSGVMDEASTYLGESQKNVSSATKSIVSGILGSVINNSNNTALTPILNEAGNQYDLVKSSLGDIFKGQIPEALKNTGASFLGTLFGTNLEKFSGLISSENSISEKSSNHLMGMLAPVVASTLGLKMQTDNLTLPALATELNQDEEGLYNFLPKGFAGALGLASLGALGANIKTGAQDIAAKTLDGADKLVDGVTDVTGKAVEGAGKLAKGAVNLTGKVVDGVSDATEKITDGAGKVVSGAVHGVNDLAKGAVDGAGKVVDGATDLASDAVVKTGSFIKWLMPLLLVIGGILLLVYLMKGCNKDKEEAPATTVVDTQDTVATASTEPENIQVELPNGVVLDAKKGGIEDQMVEFLKSGAYATTPDSVFKKTWYNFHGVEFAFGKTDSLLPGSELEVKNVSEILKAYPDAKIHIGAYTDKKGDNAVNLRISQGRANYLKKQFEALGVGAQIHGAEGYGSKFATVDASATDEERAVDRHMSVRFAK